MKKVIALLLLLATLFAFTSCQKPEKETTMLSALLSYAVPGVFFIEQDKADFAVLDKDVWGRMLIRYTYENLLDGKETTAYVICQRYDETYLYFYEDVCFFVGEAAEDDITALKAQNDWTLPYEDSKMSRRMVETSKDGKRLAPQSEYLYNEVYDRIYSTLGVREDDELTLYFDDEDLAGRDLYFIVHDPFRPKRTVYYYFVICDENYDLKYFKVENEEDYTAALDAFKAQNGWTYGFES